MGEPVRRLRSEDVHGEEQEMQRRLYATDVLLIAEASEDAERRRTGGEELSAEPLNVENVVRKLIALLSEQHP